MRRSALFALLPVSLFLLASPGCGGSASHDSQSGGQAGNTASGGAATTGGQAATGGHTATGGQATTGGQGTGGESDICALPQLGPGPQCTALITSFWHNPKTGECEPFEYGGCGATANHFESLAACQAACAGKPSLDACDRATDCALTSPGCCAACEPLEITDLIAINGNHLADKVCNVACGACAQLTQGQTATSRYFVPRCERHRCTVVDVRETELTSCKVDSDCRLRLGAQCCEACTSEPVAVNVDANFCPDGALPCPACMPRIPAGYASSCVAGRCVVSEPACTLSHPCP